MMYQNIAGIFKTVKETEKFLQKLPIEFSAHSQFEVNDDLFKILKRQKLDIEKSNVVVIVETPNNSLLKIQSLIKRTCGKYVAPETLNTWGLKGLN